jgi:Ca2+-binding RTX toxin-like protein
MEGHIRTRAARRTIVMVGLLAALLWFAGPAVAAQRAIDGSAGADYLRGSRAADLIFGLGGDDTLRGRAGGDRLVGGRGDDLLKGGPGLDTYVCGTGFDVVVSDYFRHPDEQVGRGCEAVIFEEPAARS